MGSCVVTIEQTRSNKMTKTNKVHKSVKGDTTIITPKSPEPSRQA